MRYPLTVTILSEVAKPSQGHAHWSRLVLKSIFVTSHVGVRYRCFLQSVFLPFIQVELVDGRTYSLLEVTGAGSLSVAGHLAKLVVALGPCSSDGRRSCDVIAMQCSWKVLMKLKSGICLDDYGKPRKKLMLD